MSYIEFKNVSKIYKMGEVEIKALDETSFTAEKGELVVVLGASGAGKSTILNLIGGMDDITSGEIIIDDKKVSSFNERELTDYRRFDIGFVFQFYNLVQNLTAKENVELALQLSKNPMKAEDALKMVGLENRMYNFPSQLSGGEQQRVAIARAVAKNPKLLLCDEPTGALDFVTGKQVLKVLQDFAFVNGMTVIMITHNSALAELGNKVIHVKSGKVVSETYNDKPLKAEDVEY